MRAHNWDLGLDHQFVPCPRTGFVLEDNLHDALMVACPLPPREEWDDVMHARLALLEARGLSPRFFLPASQLQMDTSRYACHRIACYHTTTSGWSDKGSQLIYLTQVTDTV